MNTPSPGPVSMFHCTPDVPENLVRAQPPGPKLSETTAIAGSMGLVPMDTRWS